MSEIVYVDRYSGTTPPDPKTICKGPCEGMGLVPTFVMHAGVPDIEKKYEAIAACDEKDAVLRDLWFKAHLEAGEHACDGWHFVTCPDCKGSGKRGTA